MTPAWLGGAPQTRALPAALTAHRAEILEDPPRLPNHSVRVAQPIGSLPFRLELFRPVNHLPRHSRREGRGRLAPGPGEAALHRLQCEQRGRKIPGVGQILQPGEGLPRVAGPQGALEKDIVSRRRAPFTDSDQHFGDLGGRGHCRVANPMSEIDGETPFAGGGASGCGADAAVDGGFDDHAPHEKAEFLNAIPARATEGQVHQHGPDHVLRRGGCDEQSSARTAPHVQQAASLQNDHGFAKSRPTETYGPLDVPQATEGLADGPARLQQMHFHGRHRFVGQVARGIVGADDAGHQALCIIGDLPRRKADTHIRSPAFCAAA